jgi:hypothetical protein
MFAAFVDGELRGIAPEYENDFFPGTYNFLILIYSNESSGETVNFKFYDVETDLVYDIDETYDFISDDALGDLLVPTVFTENAGSSDPTNGCELPENTIYITDSGDVLYNVPTDFAGIQFTTEGAVGTSASGGEAAGVGWLLQAANGTILGFSFIAATIPSSDDWAPFLQLETELTGDVADGEIVVLTAVNWPYGFQEYVCDDGTACNAANVGEDCDFWDEDEDGEGDDNTCSIETAPNSASYMLFSGAVSIEHVLSSPSPSSSSSQKSQSSPTFAALHAVPSSHTYSWNP